MGRVIHFELGADDIERAKKFYKIFGWKMEDAKMPNGEYWLVAPGPPDETGIGGAIMPRSYNPGQAFRNVIGVDDIEDMVKKVKTAGGKVEGKIGQIPGVGRYVNIHDTEGNRVGLLQVDKPSK